MAKHRPKLNNSSSKVIEENILKENPEGLDEAHLDGIKVFKNIPQMETIEFRNDRDPGIPLEFHYASATHPLEHFKLFHGHQYTLPVEIIKHLETRALPIYSYKKGPDGHPEMYVAAYKYQFTCRPIRN